jgi:glycine/D-amino acid oxidase-like deaminating enzyme
MKRSKPSAGTRRNSRRLSGFVEARRTTPLHAQPPLCVQTYSCPPRSRTNSAAFGEATTCTDSSVGAVLDLTVRPSLAPPWWLDEALAAEVDAPDAPALQADDAVDVAIVGAGYTGLWTALALRERDPSLRIAVLEKEIVGWGPSGRNGGFLHGYWTHLARLRAAFGGARALELCRISDPIVPAVRALCEAYGADIWLREAGYLKVSAAPFEDDAVDRAVAAARDLGVPDECVPLTAEEVAERVRSPRFRKGALFRNGATVQPARLARLLQRAAIAAGVELYERTPVTRLVRGSPSVLETPGGRLRASEVVLATNAWLAAWPPMSRKLTNFGSYVVLTEPVPELLEEVGWTGGEALSDGRMFLHYFRTTPDGRVLMGSGSGPMGSSVVDGRFTADRSTVARAELGLRKLLPGLAEARITHAWGGPIDVSSDHLPVFGTGPGTRVHYGAGYSGSGVGASWLGGQILASLVLGVEDEYTALPLVSRRVPNLPPEPIKSLGGALVRGAILRCEEAEEDGARAPLLARAVAHLPRIVGLQVGTR